MNSKICPQPSMLRINLFSILLVALIAFQALPLFAREPDDDHGEHGLEAEHKETVQLDASELNEFGIVVSEAGPAAIREFLELPGEIQVNDNKLAHIVPRFSGVVTGVKAQIGDQVKSGQVLAVIESDESLAPYELKTLIDGTVIEKHITLGEAVSRDHATFVVADMSSVWVDITVYQRDLPRVSQGQQAIISGAPGLPEVSGEIVYVAPIVSETTRTALARVVLPNPEGKWRPGTFIMASILIEEFNAPVAIPRTALQMMGGKNIVFIETKDGFVPRDVTLGRVDRQRFEILSGLTPGDKYVSKGGFTLKAELGKESLGEGHGH